VAVIRRDGSRLDLLQATLRHAFEASSYYRRRFAGLPPDLDSEEDIRRFPLLSRQTLVRDGFALLTCSRCPEYISLTSGSILRWERGQRPLLKFHTEGERRMRKRVLQALHNLAGSGPRPRWSDRPTEDLTGEHPCAAALRPSYASLCPHWIGHWRNALPFCKSSWWRSAPEQQRCLQKYRALYYK
jgi:hypothetical protein